jgi:hypothetical protein
MPTPDEPIELVRRHLSAALSSLADCLAEGDPRRQPELAVVARQLTEARAQSDSPPPGIVPGGTIEIESDDERTERKASEVGTRVDRMLGLMCKTKGERRFAKAVGEQIVDLVTEAYAASNRERKHFDGACITAAVAVALTIVHDHPSADRAT